MAIPLGVVPRATLALGVGHCPLLVDRPSCNDDNGDGDGFDDVIQPDHQDNWYEDLGEASGLDTSPDSGHLTPRSCHRGVLLLCHGGEAGVGGP